MTIQSTINRHNPFTKTKCADIEDPIQSAINSFEAIVEERSAAISDARGKIADIRAEASRAIAKLEEQIAEDQTEADVAKQRAEKLKEL